MSIGLYDADFIELGLSPFNLELMKLATYYKKKKEIVSLSPTFSPEKYTKFIYRKDQVNDRFQPHLLEYENVEYGGLAFSNGEYFPLPKEIETCKPDPSVYTNFVGSLPLTTNEQRKINTQLKAQHLRLSLDGKTVWKDYLKPTNYPDLRNVRTFYIHDADLGHVEGAPSAIRELASMSSQNVVETKYPIKVYNFEQLKEYNALPLSVSTKIEYMGLLSDEEICYIVENFTPEQIMRINYNITYGIKDEQEFIEKRMRKIYKQIIFLRTHFRYLTLIYSAQILVQPQWIVLLGLWNAFLASTKTIPKERAEETLATDSLYRFVKSILTHRKSFVPTVRNTREEVRDAFMFINDLDYDTFRDFYECHSVKLEGGELV